MVCCLSWKYSNPFRTACFLLLQNFCPFRLVCYLFLNYSKPFRVFACYYYSKIPVPFEIVRFKRFARCFSNTLTPFERSAPRLKVVQSLSSAYSLYLQYSSPCKAVFPCFANTLTLFERYASTSVLFGRSAPCLSNIPCFFGAVCNLIREYSSPF